MSYRWDEDPPLSAWQQTEDPKVHWNQRLEEARKRDGGVFLSDDQGGLLLGTNATGREVRISFEKLRTHMHVLGATNVGKSFFLEGMIKSLIMDGRGVCVIDPHGDLYERVLSFCAEVNQVAPELELSQRVIPFNIAETSQILGFNPIARNAKVKTFQVVSLMEAVRKCWGAGSFQETPRLARWLYNTLYAVIDSGMTFLQTYHMVNPQQNLFRTAITRRITDANIKGEWESLARMKSDEKREDRVESCLNRIKPFVGHELIRHIVGRRTDTINFNDVLAEQKILLVNLAGQNTISRDDASLIGTLLVNELLTAAFARRRGERPPYYLFIDEFQHFVTKDICEILDGGRKFGLHLILAHQHLNQLKLKDPEVYYSTLTNARTKVVFGGLSNEDLDILAKELYTGELDPDQVKKEIWQTKFEPVESDRIIITESDSESGSESTSTVSHKSLSEGATYIPGTDGWISTMPNTYAIPDAVNVGSSDSSGESTSESRSWSRSTSTTTVPFYEMHKFAELSSVAFRSLEDQLYIKIAMMKRQPTQHAAILIPGEHVELVKTPTIEVIEAPYLIEEEFKRACFRAAGCFKTPAEAEHELQTLEASLLIGDSVDTEGADDDVDLFD